jgi:hypothetical protein
MAENETPSREEELRGAQPPNDSERDSVLEHERRESGKTADVVDVYEFDETGLLRTAHPASKPDASD